MGIELIEQMFNEKVMNQIQKMVFKFGTFVGDDKMILSVGQISLSNDLCMLCVL